MQKIIIKNFGPIKDAEIEIKNILVLIGEQASGKSTVAKLIYFFKSLGDDFFFVLKRTDLIKIDFSAKRISDSFSKEIRKKLFNFFPSIFNNTKFYIKFYFSESTFIEIKFKELTNQTDSPLIDNILIDFSLNFLNYSFIQEFSRNDKQSDEPEPRLSYLIDYKEQTLIENKRLLFLRKNVELVDKLFNSKINSKLFLVAGREAVISNSNIFDAYVEKAFTNRLDDKKINEQTIDEFFLLSFLFKVREIKSIFEKYGGNFSSVIRNLKNDGQISTELIKKINFILKGDYKIDQSGEKFIHEDGQFIFMKDASSGQKEVIRIIQDLVLIILEKQNALRIIEEPEAHLFPVAQKQLVELLVYMKNYNPNNQIIITTHSPYILTVLNNLLFASRVVKKSPHSEDEVAKIIPKVFRIDPNDFAAYSLGNSLEEDAEYCEDIFNKETGVIMQNFLDIVSEMLGGDFNFLYSLHAKNFRAVS